MRIFEAHTTFTHCVQRLLEVQLRLFPLALYSKDTAQDTLCSGDQPRQFVAMSFLQRLERLLLCSLHFTEQQVCLCQCQLTFGPRLRLHPFKKEGPPQRPFSSLKHARHLFTRPYPTFHLNVDHHCLSKAHAAQNNQSKPDTRSNSHRAADGYCLEQALTCLFKFPLIL